MKYTDKQGKYPTEYVNQRDIDYIRHAVLIALDALKTNNGYVCSKQEIIWYYQEKIDSKILCISKGGEQTYTDLFFQLSASLLEKAFFVKPTECFTVQRDIEEIRNSMLVFLQPLMSHGGYLCFEHNIENSERIEFSDVKFFPLDPIFSYGSHVCSKQEIIWYYQEKDDVNILCVSMGGVRKYTDLFFQLSTSLIEEVLIDKTV